MGYLTSRQLRDLVSLRNSELSRLHTETMNANTASTAQLAEESSRETHTMKTLTVLALVFVPASFVAVSPAAHHSVKGKLT